jgi:feruloyl esterase
MSLEIGLWNLPVNGSNHIPSLLFPAISDEVLRQCDPQDGLVDSIISDPIGCNFFPEALLCTPTSNQSTCLTETQLKTLYKVYNDWIDVSDTFVFPHFMLGSEAQYGTLVDTDAGVPSIAYCTCVFGVIYWGSEGWLHWSLIMCWCSSSGEG